MNSSVWNKSLSSTSNICLDRCTVNCLSSFEPDPLPSNSNVPSVSVTVNEGNKLSMKILQEGHYYSSDEAGSGVVCSSQKELNGTRRHLSPESSSFAHLDWSLNSGHQAKRARVENIIKGMTSSPGTHCMDMMVNQHEKMECTQQNERTGEIPSHQDPLERSRCDSLSQDQTTSNQVESQQQHLQQLRAKFTRVDEVKLMNYFQSKPERIKLMADVLKYELTRAVSRSVDSVFKSMPLLQASLNNQGNGETDVPLQSSVCNDKKIRHSCCGNTEGQVPDVQTEALSLVVQKPRLDKFVLPTRSRAHHHPKPQVPISHDSTLHEDQPSPKFHDTSHQHAQRCLQDGYTEVSQGKFEMFDTQWDSVKVRSKVNSRSMRSSQTHTVSVGPMLLESLCLPHVKIESDSLVKNNLYMLNEGLTMNHLKKAKLMFFYTRYPSSLVLKTCFHNVQFTRCITSQLIKWFSNFREFYYIQMEKFARHALMEGVADVRGLTVGRESELFRALNMHYNKANDFQVPDRFLEVSEITLREFYIAISMGKDRDPSWKKAIYKVICKLDSDIPAEFKSHHCG
uniref:Prospero domain-containing protein n=2 Tax=Echeneis naucrates TaxID=173247 RepID=A0A665UNU9_ECHNA